MAWVVIEGETTETTPQTKTFREKIWHVFENDANGAYDSSHRHEATAIARAATLNE